MQGYGSSNSNNPGYPTDPNQQQFHSFGAKARETPRIGVPESVSPRQPHQNAASFKVNQEDDVDDGVNSYKLPS